MLTPEQLPAATSRHLRSFVRAAPGSGKTFVTVERYGWLRYKRHRYDSRGIAAVSFARSASWELRLRISRRWGRQLLGSPCLVDTFDELHRQVLRFLLANDHIRWPGGHTDLDVHETWRRFPETKQQGASHKPLTLALTDEGLVEIIERTAGRKPKAYFVDEGAYSTTLAQGLATHDEVRAVLHAALVDLQPDLRQEVARFLNRRFAHLLVDEVFDLNELDTRLLEVAVNAGLGLTLVGDPWQSIFEWRGSTPKLVDELMTRTNFEPIRIVGSHRYRTSEMQSLAKKLVDGEPFTLSSPEDRRRPSVVIADRWQSLWQTDALPILPCGVGRVDGTRASAALTLLLNDFTSELFSVAAADLRNAQIALDLELDRRQFQQARAAIADKHCDISEVWSALYNGLGRPTSWGTPKVRAGEYLQRLMSLVRSGEPLILGTSTHQSKGLEWPHVDYVTDMEPGVTHQLEPGNAAHRRKYVALTRAERTVRVRPLPPKVALQMRYEKD